MVALRSFKHEKFAQHVAAGSGLAGAYLLAGYEPGSAELRNYNKIARRPEVAARIAE